MPIRIRCIDAGIGLDTTRALRLSISSPHDRKRHRRNQAGEPPWAWKSLPFVATSIRYGDTRLRASSALSAACVAVVAAFEALAAALPVCLASSSSL